MRSWLVILTGVVALAFGSAAPLTAQEATPEAESGTVLGIAPVFSNQILPTLGYPELTLRETGDGIADPPETLTAGRYLIALEAPDITPAYLVFVQVPEGLSQAEAEEQLLLAARDDEPSPGWIFGGGSFAMPGTTVHFVVELTPGDWHIAATRETEPPSGGEVEEWVTLHPLSVTADAASPTPAVEPEIAVTLEMQDIAFSALDSPLATGPRLWEVTNTGEQPRQLVLFRTPELVTAQHMSDILMQLMGGADPADIPLWNEFTWVGYVAILSPGHTVWIEFDFEPGIYAATSWVADEETGMPALMLGMVEGFTVE